MPRNIKIDANFVNSRDIILSNPFKMHLGKNHGSMVSGDRCKKQLTHSFLWWNYSEE